MQKTLNAVLLLLVLVLSAALVRVLSREHLLEERLAAAERVRSPKPALAPPPIPATVSPAPEVPIVPAPTSLEQKINPPPLTMTIPRSALEAAPAGSGLQILLVPQEQAAGRRPGYLGITGIDAEGGGVQVSQVQPGTVAGLSGLRPGDVILEVNGEKVGNYSDLAALVQKYGEGGPVTLRIRRGATEFYQGAQLGPRPP